MITVGLPDSERYFTHRPLLRAAMEATRGDVLELGSGDGSTPLLKHLCATSGRMLLSAEGDWSWYRKLLPLVDVHHRALFVRDWSSLPVLPPTSDRWGVVFVDNAPAKSRRANVSRFQGAADIIVVHDTEPENQQHYGFSDDLWNRFRYVLHDARTRCRTTALSDRVDLTEWRFAS